MNGFFRVFVLSLGLVLSGCATETTWILMPDQSGKTGAITVKTDSDFQVIDQAYESAVLKSGSATLALSAPSSATQVSREYRRLLQAEPKQSTSFMLYFKSGSVELTPISQHKIPEVIDRIKSQSPTEITLIGHTDTTGTDEFNNRLSLRRAQVVEKLLKDGIPALDVINLQYFGAKKLLIPTAPNVEEQKNRVVEVMIL